VPCVCVRRHRTAATHGRVAGTENQSQSRITVAPVCRQGLRARERPGRRSRGAELCASSVRVAETTNEARSRARVPRSRCGARGSRRSPGPARCCDQGFGGGRDRRRSGDPALFRRVLCRLSYPASRRRPPQRRSSAVLTGFEPAASALTGRRALQTAPQDQMSRRQLCRVRRRRCPQGSSNPRYRLERAASWATRRWGLGLT
jgi:hypothetical protein